MLKYAVSVLGLSLAFGSSVFAAGNVKAGLWELTTESAAMKNMPEISPEQIEQMRKMGVDLTRLQSGVIINKVCVTKEMAARDELPQMNHKESGCEIRNQQHTGSNYTMDVICDGPKMKGKGVLKTSFSGNESFSSSSEFKGMVNGTPINDRNSTSGKWLSADCGSIKPIPEMPPRK